MSKDTKTGAEAMSEQPRQRVLVDTVSAAVAVDRPQATIRNWAHRGVILRQGTDGGGRALYDLAEVYQASVRLTSRRDKPRRDG
jgi:hypothetical protein